VDFVFEPYHHDGLCLLHPSLQTLWRQARLPVLKRGVAKPVSEPAYQSSYNQSHPRNFSRQNSRKNVTLRVYLPAVLLLRPACLLQLPACKALRVHLAGTLARRVKHPFVLGVVQAYPALHKHNMQSEQGTHGSVNNTYYCRPDAQPRTKCRKTNSPLHPPQCQSVVREVNGLLSGAVLSALPTCSTSRLSARISTRTPCKWNNESSQKINNIWGVAEWSAER
jgi:hypothetical protein